MKAISVKCPAGHGNMLRKEIPKNAEFRGVAIEYVAKVDICPKCGLEVADLKEAGRVQRIISDTYRTAVGLLTGAEIRENRKKLGFTQKELADRSNIGVASIKRWEAGVIQSKSMDMALRWFFNNRFNRVSEEHKDSFKPHFADAPETKIVNPLTTYSEYSEIRSFPFSSDIISSNSTDDIRIFPGFFKTDSNTMNVEVGA